MRSIIHICFILNNYPTKTYPIDAFVRPVVCGLADNGFSCTVIAPQSLTGIVRNHIEKRPIHWKDKSNRNNIINIYQPFFLSFSDFKICGRSVSSIFRDRIIKKNN